MLFSHSVFPKFLLEWRLLLHIVIELGLALSVRFAKLAFNRKSKHRQEIQTRVWARKSEMVFVANLTCSSFVRSKYERKSMIFEIKQKT